jgi:DNA-binding NarL/FixJ family response regulator
VARKISEPNAGRSPRDRRSVRRWQFTPAEKEIAGLILKGCSHKQIADIRRSSDSTVRQQAQAIYRKSGLENRSELAAYFLDAILYAPPDDTAVNVAPLPFKKIS